MGLSISRSIVKAHGGRLWVTTNVPKGALFQFTLPIGAESENDASEIKLPYQPLDAKDCLNHGRA
jgi:signal transduction histidine kinase